MTNPELEKIAEKILAKLDKKDVYGNPIAILMIVSIVLTCIRIIQECNKNKKLPKDQNQYSFCTNTIREISKRRTWFTKMRIKKILRKELSKELYKIYSNDLTEALLNIGEIVKDDDIIILMENLNV